MLARRPTPRRPEPRPPSIATALAVLLTLLGPSQDSAAQPVVPVGNEMQVNVFTTDRQEDARIVADGAGGFLVVWENLDGGDRIVGRRLDSVGAPVGSELVINAYTTGTRGSPRVAFDSLGGFSVVWTNFSATPTDSDRSVRGRTFDAADSPVTGDFQVNTVTSMRQHKPAIGQLATGFVVVFEDYSGTDEDVRARRFDAAGVPIGDDFLLSSYTTGDQKSPEIAPDGNGGLWAVWHSKGTSGSDTDATSMQLRRLDASGLPIGNDFQVNTFTTNDQYYGLVSPLDDGFVVAWQSDPIDGGSTDYDVVARRFQSDGTPVGTEFKVSEDHEFGAVGGVAADGDEGFLVVWENVDGSPRVSWGRHYDAQDAPTGDQFVLAAITGVDARNPAVASQAAGDFVVVWDSNLSNGTDTDNRSIQARRFALDHDEDGVGTPVDTCTDLDGDGFGNPGFPANTCAEDNCPDISNPAQTDADGDSIGDDCDACQGDNATGDGDYDGVCNNLDICLGNDASGDGDFDGLCADIDCNDADALDPCDLFEDGFESGNTSVWSNTLP